MEAEVPDSEFPRSFTPGKRKFQVPDKIQRSQEDPRKQMPDLVFFAGIINCRFYSAMPIYIKAMAKN